jgi:CCAAT-binding transcription factor (CBF-B/NF-YA) subunit B
MDERGIDQLFLLNYNNHIEYDAQNTVEEESVTPAQEEEPLYVNAKQYFRILKRRVARARLDELHRLSRQRKVGFDLYIHLFKLLLFIR